VIILHIYFFYSEYQEEGIWVYDCVYQEMVLVLPSILALLGDNPMQSEFACHAGLQSKFFCRSCWVKGKDAENYEEMSGTRTKTETFEGMVNRVRRFMKVVSLFYCLLITINYILIQIGERRTPSQTQNISKQTLDNVIQMAPQKTNQSLRTSSGVKDKFLHSFLDKIERATKKLSGDRAEQVTQTMLAKMPANSFSPVWRIKGVF
jgi:hypothetical protein